MDQCRLFILPKISHKLGFFYCYRREQTGNYPRKLRICIGINITGCNANRSLNNVQPK